jgi:branched-chain amino acid transport system permease protein
MRLASRRRLAVVVGGGLLALVASGLSSYWLFLATSAVIYAVIALSVGVVYGRSGMVALCPMAFAGIGAWTVGWLRVSTALPFLAAALVGGLAAVPVGLAIGLPTLRLRGVNLAVVTLAFGSAVSIVTFDQGFPGALDRLAVRRPAVAASERGYFVLVVATFAAAVVVLMLLDRTTIGASWLAVRDSERATAALGHSVVRTKLTVIVASAFVAGVGGALMAGQLGLLSGVGFQPAASLVVFTAAVAFGSAYAEGALLAGVAAVFLPEILRRLGLPQDVAPAVFAVAALHALSGGEAGVAGGLRTKLAGRRTAAAPVVARPAVGRATVHDRAAPPDGRPAALEVVDVSVTYGSVRALDAVSLTVRQGTVHGLIGPNGAGKTTLVDVVSGFLPQASGRVVFLGEAIESLPVHRRAQRGLRRTFQQGRVSPRLTVGQYVTLASGRVPDAGVVGEVLDAFHCPAADTLLAQVDVGTRRIVQIAAALTARPKLLLLDEPSAGLADEESAELAMRIAELPAVFGCTAVVIEHDMALVAGCCDAISVLDFGRLVMTDRPEVVLADPLVQRAYLGVDAAEVGT